MEIKVTLESRLREERPLKKGRDEVQHGTGEERKTDRLQRRHPRSSESPYIRRRASQLNVTLVSVDTRVSWE